MPIPPAAPYKDALTFGEPPVVAKPLQSGEPRDGHGGGVLKRNFRGLCGNPRFFRARVFGKRSRCDTENHISGFELRYIGAHGFDIARHITARLRGLLFADKFYDAPHRRMSQHVVIERVDRRRADSDQDLVRGGRRLFDLGVAESVRQSSLVIDDRLHMFQLSSDLPVDCSYDELTSSSAEMFLEKSNSKNNSPN